jgi:hypothetical protein
MEIFLQRGLDTPVNKPPDGQITTRQREQIPLVSRTRRSVLHAALQSLRIYLSSRQTCEADFWRKTSAELYSKVGDGMKG